MWSIIFINVVLNASHKHKKGKGHGIKVKEEVKTGGNETGEKWESGWQPLGEGESDLHYLKCNSSQILKRLTLKQLEPKIYYTMNSGPHWIGEELSGNGLFRCI